MKIKQCSRRRLHISACSILGFFLSLFGAAEARAYYIGYSYIRIDGLPGGALEPGHKDWLRAEAHYWNERPALREIRGISGKESGLKFSESPAPVSGPNVLNIAVDKKSPGINGMMDLCHSRKEVPVVTFAESSELARHPQEHGPRPSDVPEYYEYKLQKVRLSCPVVSDAPEQAFKLHFEQIERLNYAPKGKVRTIAAKPAKLPHGARGGARKVFVVSWFAPVADSRPDQCSTMNAKPSQDDYYALMSPERASQQRAFLKEKGGANTTVLPYRGPGEMNVTMLPGIVRDPGLIQPQVDVVRGFNLDNNDGTGEPSASFKVHKNFTSPDGEKGIDNQLFVIQGCIAGWKRNGFLPMIGNELRRAGGLSILIEVSGIDDMRNDSDVAVTILYSTDPMRRDGASKEVLPDFTFRVNDSVEYSQDFARFRGKIIDGVLTTEPVDKVYLHEGPATTWPMANARMRIEFATDGSMKALLGGYRDWREFLSYAFFRSSDYENTIGYNSPGLYNAVKRAADGIRDPLTGEFNGISAAYEIEGVPAFIPPRQTRKLAVGADR